MKNRKRLIGRCFIASLVLFLMPLTEAWAWGPERETYTMEEPADHVTFNSITDNPSIGDERDFVRIGEVNSDKTAIITITLPQPTTILLTTMPA